MLIITPSFSLQKTLFLALISKHENTPKYIAITSGASVKSMSFDQLLPILGEENLGCGQLFRRVEREPIDEG